MQGFVAPVPEIVQGEEGRLHGTTGMATLTLLNEGGRMFKRRAIKKAGTDGAYEVAWLVGELDGVRVYIHGSDVVMTREELYP